MDPLTCCALGLCCPPASDEQFAAFEQVLTAQFGAEKAKKISAKMRKDLVAFTKKLKKVCDES